MQTQANNQDAREEGLDRENLLKTVVSLRQDVVSMGSDIREVIQENERLKNELSRLRQHRPGAATQSESRLDEVQRMKQEIDELVRLHERTSTGRVGARRSAEREAPESSDQDGWKKKMMMMMVLAQLF